MAKVIHRLESAYISSDSNPNRPSRRSNSSFRNPQLRSVLSRISVSVSFILKTTMRISA